MAIEQTYDERRIIRATEKGRGKRALVVAAVAVAVAGLVGYEVASFHGRHIYRNAAALVQPVPAH